MLTRSTMSLLPARAFIATHPSLDASLVASCCSAIRFFCYVVLSQTLRPNKAISLSLQFLFCRRLVCLDKATLARSSSVFRHGLEANKASIFWARWFFLTSEGARGGKHEAFYNRKNENSYSRVSLLLVPSRCVVDKTVGNRMFELFSMFSHSNHTMALCCTGFASYPHDDQWTFLHSISTPINRFWPSVFVFLGSKQYFAVVMHGSTEDDA